MTPERPHTRCSYCHRVAASIALTCRSTRDMEDRASEGDARCHAALIDMGGGERAVERVHHQMSWHEPPPRDDEPVIARLRAQIGPRDDFPLEDATVRAGDVWFLLEELERLHSVNATLWTAVGSLTAWYDHHRRTRP